MQKPENGSDAVRDGGDGQQVERYRWYAMRQWTWVRRAARRTRAAVVARLLRQHADAEAGGLAFLEIGPGHGDFAEALAELLPQMQYTAVEGNPQMVAELRNKGMNVVEAYVPPLPFPDDHFDVVYLEHVIEHQPTYNGALELIGECARVLRDNGLVFVLAPNYFDSPRLFFEYDYSHGFPTTLARLERLALDAGVTVLRKGLYVAPFITNPVARQGVRAFRALIPWRTLGLGAVPTALMENCYIVARKG